LSKNSGSRSVLNQSESTTLHLTAAIFGYTYSLTSYTYLQGYPGLTKSEDDYMRGMAVAATGMDMDTGGGSGQSVVAHHPQWSGGPGGSGGGGGGVPVGPPPPGPPPHGARPVPHPPGLQPPGPASSATAVSSALHQNGGGLPPPPPPTMENNVSPASAAIPLQAAAVPHSYSSPATLSYTREEGRGEHWVAPPPTRLQVPVLIFLCLFGIVVSVPTQCCGSGMFLSRIRPFSHPGSGSKHFFIPDPGSYMKSGVQT
jgi:hypothetical protein